MSLADFRTWVEALELELATGKVTPAYSPFADALARTRVTFDARRRQLLGPGRGGGGGRVRRDGV
jgi:hypothetical protein